MPSTSVLPTNGSAHRGTTRGLHFKSGRNIPAILLGLVVFLEACSETSPTDTTEPLPKGTPVQAQPPSEGQALFIAKGCAACHGQNAEGSAIAPALPGHNAAMVERQVRNPRFRMPAFSESQVSDAELEAIGHYIANLSGEGHAHPETIELSAAVEMHHWMALEALKADDRAEAIHHVNHIIELLNPGEHRQRMVAILESLGAREIHEPEHEIEEMLAGTAAPDLSLFHLHLRQASASLAVNDRADARHHLEHAQGLAELDDEVGVYEALEALEQGELHQVDHEIQELLGEDEHND